MKKLFHYIIILLASLNLCACDYFAWFDFKVENSTDDWVKVAYLDQMQSFTTKFYTPGHDDDFQSIHLEDYLTDTIIPPRGTLQLHYDAGLAYKGFADTLEDPEEYGIVPLWERIGYIILGSDTLPSMRYSKEQWFGKGSTYTLVISR